MRHVLKTGIFLLLLSLPLSLSALDFGVRFNFGISSGIGQGWNDHLDKAGGRDLSDVLGTAGAGLFVDYELGQALFISPEFSLVINRGVKMSNTDGEYISIAADGSLELILPLHLEFPVSPQTAFRLTGGLQLISSPELKEKQMINGLEENRKFKNDNKLSAGIVLGGGMVFRRDKKISVITDLRAKIPFTDTISFRAADGSSVHLKTLEILAGTGIRF